jgi:hypothetical protein
LVPWVLVASTALSGAGIGPVLAQVTKEAGWPPPDGAACKPSKKDTEEAKTLFGLGKNAYETSNYTDAIKYYRDAYKRDCTAHLLLKNLGKAFEADAQYANAVDAYKLYRTRGKPTGDELDQLDQKITNLSKKVESMGTGGTATTPTTTGTPTTTTTTTTTETAPTTTATTTATGTSTAPPPSGGPGIAPWIVVGIGGALFVGGGIIWLGSNSTVSKKQTEFNNPLNDGSVSCGRLPSVPPPGLKAQCDTIAKDGTDAKNSRTAGVVVTLIGVAAVGGGLAWYFLGSKDDKKSASTQVAPVVGPGYAGLGLSGSF